ncbi:MAG: archaeosortase/exosortase family protein [Candidatus Diapherotrites archaeon]
MKKNKSISKKKAHKHPLGRVSWPVLKRELVTASKFLLVFVFSFLILSFIFYSLFLEITAHVIAIIASKLLGIFGYSSEVILGEPVIIIVNAKYMIEISYLCTGLLETAVIISAILASFGIDLKKRGLGVIIGIIFVNSLNIFRILVTIFAITNTQDSVYLEFIHNVLFKVTLFVGIALYYAIWFGLATNLLNLRRVTFLQFLNKKAAKAKKQ